MRMIQPKGNIRLLDVGGTFVKCDDGRSVPIDSGGEASLISSSLREAVGDISDIDKIGIAIPGPFDYANGVFLMRHKFASVYGRSFRELVGIPDGIGLFFIHDVNCMLLGEMTAGAAKGYGRVALVSIGTGLGFATSSGGKVLCNSTGSPAISIWDRPYRDGILEDYVSKRGILSLYRGLSGRDVPDVIDIEKAAEVSDGAALQTYGRIGSSLAEAIWGQLKVLGTECLLFGGGISHGFKYMEQSVKAALVGLELGYIGPVSNYRSATFNGLMAA
ncbi:MAG: ROK family protein, partial [Bacteroidales bacterium]|nr:ROK family protein [Bacteroidales bacterium]